MRYSTSCDPRCQGFVRKLGRVYTSSGLRTCGEGYIQDSALFALDHNRVPDETAITSDVVLSFITEVPSGYDRPPVSSFLRTGDTVLPLARMDWLSDTTNKTVFKNGRTTGPTAGVLHNVEPSTKTTYRTEDGGWHYTVQGKSTICIRPFDGSIFANKGDSGALVMDCEARAVGMLNSIIMVAGLATTCVTPALAVLADVKRALVEAGLEVEDVEIV